jgi:hypothetical protein
MHSTPKALYYYALILSIHPTLSIVYIKEFLELRICVFCSIGLAEHHVPSGRKHTIDLILTGAPICVDSWSSTLSYGIERMRVTSLLDCSNELVGFFQCPELLMKRPRKPCRWLRYTPNRHKGYNTPETCKAASAHE